MSERVRTLSPRPRRLIPTAGFAQPIPTGLTAFRFLTGDGRKLLVYGKRLKSAYNTLNKAWLCGLNVDDLTFIGEGEPAPDDGEWKRIR